MEDINTTRGCIATSILKIAENLRMLSENLEAAVIAEARSEEPDNTPIPSQSPTPELQPVTLEQVRAVLAEKSQDGKIAEVRALISKYGAKKLSEVDPTHYAALLADSEEL